MSLDYEELRKSLVPIFVPYLSNGDQDYYLILDNGKAEAPDNSYASMLILSVVDVGTLDLGCIDGNGQQVKKDQYLTIRIQTFGEGAYSAANRLQTAIEFESVLDKLDYIGIGVQDQTSVRDISRRSQGTREERAVFEIVLCIVDGSFHKPLDDSKQGQSSQPLYDAGVVPVEKVCVSTTLNRDGSSVYTNTVPIETET